MDPQKTPPVTDPALDLGEILRRLIRSTGAVQESMGGFRIKVDHTRGFPWADVFKELLYRDFQVNLARHKADIFIEARV